MGKVYSNSDMLAWVALFSDKMSVSPEKIKLINICGVDKNVLPTIETHKRVMIFVDETHPDLFWKCWEAGYGEYNMWYAKGVAPVPENQEIGSCKVQDLMDRKITEPMVVFIVNENTREAQRFGIRNEFFSQGSVRYVGREIRAVIMNMLSVDSHDTICIVSGESIVIEAAIIASDGCIIAVETDQGSKRAMTENVDKFGVTNVRIVTDINASEMGELPVPRLSFIVASPDTDRQIGELLKINPKMQFIIYTLELDTLAGLKNIFDKYGIRRTETLQISVSKTDKNSVFVAQPSPWLISGEVPEQKD